jgi:cytochrome c peroxidase
MNRITFNGRHTVATILGLAGIIAIGSLSFSQQANAQEVPAPENNLLSSPVAPLDSVEVPLPENIDDFIKDRAAAIRLGKALFWDMQVGSDGQTACASCHYQGGSDGRDKNQIAPGPDGRFDNGHTVNFQLKLDRDFPFTKFTDPNDASSTKIRSSNDIVGSQGVFKVDFLGITNTAIDAGILRADATFNRQGLNTLQVTGRNAPSVINAIFNHRNFWDGRAHNEFNGVNPFGDSDVNARVYRTDPLTGETVSTHLSIKNASLASQAVGPVNSDVEMAHGGRDFASVGRKMLGLKPLGTQRVDATDSVLSGIIDPSGIGLSTSYEQLAKDAFVDSWWNGNDKFTVSGGRIIKDSNGSYKHMEANFSLIFGLAVLMYESTLVSDQTPLDNYLRGDSKAISDSAKRGLELFNGKAGCISCHKGATLTNAAIPVIWHEARDQQRSVMVESMLMHDNNVSVYDIGFYNIGVRPTADDLGVGGNDPFGNPLSFSRSLQLGILSDSIGDVTPSSRIAVNGAFKTPGLRNVALNAPYNHNGGYATLHQVINNYNRGGDFGHQNKPDTSPDVKTLDLSVFEKRDLIQLMLEMTDPRVEKRSAPFDHPELRIPNGHTIKAGSTTLTINSGNGASAVDVITIPATGRSGGSPLRRFLGNIETRMFQ